MFPASSATGGHHASGASGPLGFFSRLFGRGGASADSSMGTMREDIGGDDDGAGPAMLSPSLDDRVERFTQRRRARLMRIALVAWRLDSYRTRKRRSDVASLFCHASPRRSDCFDDETGLSVDGLTNSRYGGEPDPPRDGLTPALWKELSDPGNGHIIAPQRLFRAIVSGGVHPSLRKDCWKLLLHQYDFKQSVNERLERDAQVSTAYEALKKEWKLAALSDAASDAASLVQFLEHCNTIDQDVSRSDFHDDATGEFASQLRTVLRTYVFHNLDRGYAQGMLDLLEPVLYVLEDEASAHYCFTGLMQRSAPRFDRDADHGVEGYLSKLRCLVAYDDPELYDKIVSLDSDHFFFAYRWFLLDFKREFTKEAVLHIWEALWCAEMVVTEHFVVFVALIYLVSHRSEIMRCRNSTDIMRVFNAIARECDKHDPADVIRNAHEVALRISQELEKRGAGVTGP